MGYAVPIIMAVASYALSEENTRRTERKQDNQLATSIRNQSNKQHKADAKVNEEVAALEQSTASDERKQRLNDYMQTIQKSKGAMTSGLTPAVGSDTFKADAAKAAADVQQGAANDAGLYSRIDAPTMQRQGEAFGYGHLATDLGLIGRESQGQSFLDDLRLRAIRRNPWIDLAATTASAAGGAYGGNYGTAAAGAGSAAGSSTGSTNTRIGPR